MYHFSLFFLLHPALYSAKQWHCFMSDDVFITVRSTSAADTLILPQSHLPPSWLRGRKEQSCEQITRIRWHIVSSQYF